MNHRRPSTWRRRNISVGMAFTAVYRRGMDVNIHSAAVSRPCHSQKWTFRRGYAGVSLMSRRWNRSRHLLHAYTTHTIFIWGRCQEYDQGVNVGARACAIWLNMNIHPWWRENIMPLYYCHYILIYPKINFWSFISLDLSVTVVGYFTWIFRHAIHSYARGSERANWSTQFWDPLLEG